MKYDNRRPKYERTRWWNKLENNPRRSTLRRWAIGVVAVGAGIGLLIATTANWANDPVAPEVATYTPDTAAGAAGPTTDALTMHETLERLAGAYPKVAPVEHDGLPQAASNAEASHLRACVVVEGPRACTLPPPTMADEPREFRASHAYGVTSLCHPTASVGC
ncbi:MAG: hypothetical protein ACOC1F_03895 [Myxococcota bacterium]